MSSIEFAFEAHTAAAAALEGGQAQKAAEIYRGAIQKLFAVRKSFSDSSDQQQQLSVCLKFLELFMEELERLHAAHATGSPPLPEPEPEQPLAEAEPPLPPKFEFVAGARKIASAAAAAGEATRARNALAEAVQKLFALREQEGAAMQDEVLCKSLIGALMTQLEGMQQPPPQQPDADPPVCTAMAADDSRFAFAGEALRGGMGHERRGEFERAEALYTEAIHKLFALREALPSGGEGGEAAAAAQRRCDNLIQGLLSRMEGVQQARSVPQHALVVQGPPSQQQPVLSWEGEVVAGRAHSASPLAPSPPMPQSHSSSGGSGSSGVMAAISGLFGGGDSGGGHSASADQALREKLALQEQQILQQQRQLAAYEQQRKQQQQIFRRMAEELAEAKAAAAAAAVAPAEAPAADTTAEPEPAPEAAEEEAEEQAEEGAEPEPEPESVSALFAGSKLSSGGDLFATEPEPESGGGGDQDDLFAEGDGEGDGDLFGGGGGEDDLFAEGDGDELDEGNLFAPKAEEGIPPELQSGIELMEACTKDDTEHAPQEYLEQLATAAMDLDADEARPVAMWLAQRMGLDTDAIPPKLKSLQLVTLFLDVGSDELVADLGVHTIPAVKALLSFSAVDPTYGDRPSAMIRSTAAKVVAKATGGEAAADGAAGGAGPSDDGRGDGLLYGRASTTEDALFAQAMQRRKEKHAAEAVPATSKFTFKSGLKNLVNDLYDSSYLATKSWRVIMPSTTGGEASLGGDDDGGDTTVVSFLSVRHSGDDLTILLDGKEVRVWRQDEQLKRLWKMAPKQIEADYPFTMPGGLGGSVGIVRVATNVYEYQLDVPGEVLDLSEHWLTATVELGAIYIRKATVENEDTADAYICYEVQTLLRGQSRASGDEGYLTLKRFSEFDTLHKLVKSSFSAKLNTSKKITMPKKPSKSLLKRFDEAFVEKRRRELELYLQELIRIPAIGSNPDVLRFLNVPVNAASGGGGGAGGGAGGGSGASSAAGAPSSGDLASATEMVERVTTDDVHNAPQDTMAELARMAMATEPKMARHLAACLAQRMQIDATPVKLKSLTLLQMLMGKGSSTFQAAAGEACLEAVQDSQSYTKIDPQFGAKPAQLVQDTARKLVPRLRSAAASSAAGKTKHAQGQVIAKESTKRVDHAQGLSGEVLGWLLECTADDTEPQPPSAVEALTRLVADELNWVGGGGGRGGAAQELAEWLAGRLQGTPQAPVKLKTILLTQKLVPPAVPAVRRQLKAVCREPLMQAMHYNRADEQHGDKPARLVRAKAGELLGLLDRDGAAVRGAAAVAMARSPQQMAATAKMMSGGDDDDDDDGDDCL